METINPFDPAAPQFTAIDLSGLRRPHPDTPGDADGFAVEWLEHPTAAEVEQAVVDSLHRVSLAADLPGARIGEPGSFHLTHVYGAQYTAYGRVYGYDIIRMPLCSHGLMPPLVVEFRDGSPERRYEYVEVFGAYYPVSG